MKVAVIHYSSTGTNHRLAQEVAAGAEDAGAEVRIRRVAELAPDAAIDANPAWRKYVDEVAPTVEVATLEDLEWADAYAFGTPTRFGLPAAQLKQFIDSASKQWSEGVMAGKAVTSWASAMNVHGGNEATILTLNTVFYHWGCVIVPPGYTDDLLYAAGGNPYGTSHATGPDGDEPTPEVLAAARYQGRRLAEIGARLVD